MINFNFTNLNKKITFQKYQKQVDKIHKGIHEFKLEGSDFLGWLNYPNLFTNSELDGIQKTGESIGDKYDVLVVCGIGGSYLGARSIIEALTSLKAPAIEVMYLGNDLSSDKLCTTLKYLKGKKFAINVISKSGGTLETSIAFRILYDFLTKEVGIDKAKKSVFVTTDKTDGNLKKLSIKNGFKTFDLPRDIGGRYSVFSPVGLLPIAACGYNIKEIFKGIKSASNNLSNPNLKKNQAYQYAVARYVEYSVNKNDSELIVTYSPHLVMFEEWFKQLFAESEGKDNKGLFPMSVLFSTDLHSLGQMIQEGKKHYFETIYYVENPNNDITIPALKDDTDDLNYLGGKKLSYINKVAFESTLKAHHNQAKLDCIICNIDKVNEFNIGYLYYFLMKTCAMYCYLQKVNPFNQPGVQAYKSIMSKTLRPTKK